MRRKNASLAFSAIARILISAIILVVVLGVVAAETYYNLPPLSLQPQNILQHQQKQLEEQQRLLAAGKRIVGERTTTNGGGTGGSNDGKSAVAPIGMSSLTFVFDRTGSMNDDLNQVRQGAKGIFETVMRQRKPFIYNYVLVLFHDPDVDPPFISTDPDVFQQELASVSVQGGGDCPEMTLSGIKKALEVSLPGSYIYVFTDARSKDFHLEERILNLIQEKQSSVVFVMTGDCGNRTAPGYRVFEKIAAASFGQVFHLEKSHVNSVLEYVRHSVAQRKVHILYEMREFGQSHVTLIPVDAHFSELTLSLSGERDSYGGADGGEPMSVEDDGGSGGMSGLRFENTQTLDIQLFDPQNRSVDKNSYASEGGSIDLRNVKLIRIKEPQPGVWKVRVTSRLKHTLRVFGHGVIDFKYGFASRPVHTIDLAHPRPIAGQSTYLLVNMTGLNTPGLVYQLSLVDYYGRELFRNETRIHAANPYIYFVGPFLPPKGFFFVRVNGEDEFGYEFMRIAPTAIATVETSGPRAFMAERTTAIAYQPVNLTCSIESSTPFMVYWSFGNVIIGGPLFYERTDTSIWPIDAVTPANRGHYVCQVVSTIGNHSAVTFLDSKEPPPHITTSRNESVLLRATAHLHCRTQSVERAQIRWFRGTAISGADSVPIGNSAKIYTAENGTLRILDVTHADAGLYTCRATTSGGQAHASVHLAVHETPSAHVRPREIFVAQHAVFNISCDATGVPKPTIEWWFGATRIVPNNHFYLSYPGHLIVNRNDLQKIGTYECRAMNMVGTKSDYAVVRLAIPPEINIPQGQQLISRDDLVVIDCRVVSGTPPPKLTWFKEGRELVADQRRLTINAGRLTIRTAEENDAGTYACKAENIAGSDTKPITIAIGDPPSILPSPDKIFVNIDRSANLQCRAVGVPTPNVRWQKWTEGRLVGIEADTDAAGRHRHVTLPDGTLMIQNAQVDDEGWYVCVAQNNFGDQQKRVEVVVTGLVSPILANIPDEMQLIEGREMSVSCIVLMGNPKPTLKWFKDGAPLVDAPSIQIDSDGSSLRIRNGSASHAGRYSCAAISAAGNATVDVGVQVIKRPQIIGAIRLSSASDERASSRGSVGASSAAEDERMAVNAGATIDVDCPIVVPSGQPPPNVVWYIDGLPITRTTPNYLILRNHTLRIVNASRNQAGRYTCTAVNVAGEARKVTRVTVRTPPTIVGATTTPASGTGGLTTVEPAPTAFNVRRGDTVALPCEADGEPRPEIRWLLDGRPFVDGVIDENGALLLDAATEAHRGEFTCVAHNALGDASRRITLNVHTAPIIEGGGSGGTAKSVIVSVGDSVELACPAVAYPPPQRVWSFEGAKLDPPPLGNDDRATIRLAVENGSLIIGVAELTLAGVYSCHVSNLAGDDSIAYSLKVHSPPQILATAGTYNALLGARLDLPCRAVGLPPPLVTWTKLDDTEFLQFSTAAGGTDESLVPLERAVDAAGTLRFTRLHIADTGRYRCEARNAAGDAQSVVDVFVRAPPTILERQPSAYSAIETAPVTLHCLAGGVPLPEITWMRFDIPLTNTERQKTFHNGSLQIFSASTSDAGDYTCRATNAAGQAESIVHLEVISAPRVRESHADEPIAVEIGRSLSLQCPIVSSPIPDDIKWFHNDRPISAADEADARLYSISADRRRLHVKEANPYQAGVYKCVARNAAGAAEKRFSVGVLVAPFFDESTFERRLTVVEGQYVEIGCPVGGTPTPTIVWLINSRQLLPTTTAEEEGGEQTSRKIRLNERDNTIIIESASLSHNGTYLCATSNKAGHLDVDVELLVLAPPKLAISATSGGNGGLPSSGEYGGDASSSDATGAAALLHERVESNAGTSVTLKCDVENFDEKTSITWLYNGSSVLPANAKVVTTASIGGGASSFDSASSTSVVSSPLRHQRLFVDGVGEANQGVYECLVRNSVGELRKQFHVDVYVPPKMVVRTFAHAELPPAGGGGAPLTAGQLRARVGETLHLNCPIAGGNPPPRLQWLVDGQLFEPSDNGDDDRRWFTRGDVDYSLSENDRRLTLLNARGYGAHRYSCVAINRLGTASMDFSVQLIAPPKMIDNAVRDSVTEVFEGNSVTFECPVAVQSQPFTINWFKGSTPVEQLNERGGTKYSISVDRNRLVIVNVNRNEASIFSCVVENEAGRTDARFSINVLVPPQIVGDQMEEIEFIEGEELHLACNYDGGIPAPRITWTKDDQKLEPNEDSHVKMVSDDQLLVIEDVRGEDEALYACELSNGAGRARKVFQVRVVTAPRIRDPDSLNLVETVVERPVNFDCPISDTSTTTFGGQSTTAAAAVLLAAQPYIEIVWLRPGDIPLQGREAGVQLLNDGRRLTLLRPLLDDSGVYVCVARNAAGEAKKRFRLDVMSPPRILSTGTEDAQLKVIEDDSLIIACEADGHPTPRIEWSKDGKPLGNSSGGAFATELLSAGQQLKISRAGAAHSGLYACRAGNQVGSADANFRVDVVLRPAVADNASFEQLLEVVEGESITFTCPIKQSAFDGEIHWLKDAEPITIDLSKFSGMHSNMKLMLIKAEKSDQGNYACVARNDAGESRAEFQLNVLTAPVIRTLERNKNRTVIENSSLTLDCPATGNPEPTVVWFRNGVRLHPLNVTERVERASIVGDELRIESVQLAHAGRYTCEARNRAGAVDQDIRVQVITHPRIDRTKLEATVSGELGARLSLVCPVLGHPTPHITWLRADDLAIDEAQALKSGLHVSSSRQRLHFAQLAKDQIGQYTCVASNAAGEDRFQYNVNLLEAPRLVADDAQQQGVHVNVGATAVLHCPLMGGNPPPSVEWLRDGRQLVADVDARFRLEDGGKQLEVVGALPIDSARYTCIATNQVGAADFDVTLNVIDSPSIAGASADRIDVLQNGAVELHCDTRGTEPMTVEWQRDGRPISAATRNDMVQIADRGRKLHLLSAGQHDAGEWSCSAHNSAGMARKIFRLEVQASPWINESASSPPIVNVLPNAALRLDCVVDGQPEPTVKWLKDDFALANGVEIRLSIAPSAVPGQYRHVLTVDEAIAERDAGRYVCLAENLVGNASQSFIVKVAGPPQLEGDPVQRLDLLVGDDAVLKCQVLFGVEPTVSVRWTANGQLIGGATPGGKLASSTGLSTSTSTTVDGDKIVLSGARLSDAGEYVCTVRNSAGTSRRIFNVNVMGTLKMDQFLERPRFMDTTNTQYSVISGRPLILDCSAIGTPTPLITWTKDGRALNDAIEDEDSSTILVNGNQQLHIEDVTQHHAGRYSCIAENLPGRAEKDILVTILRAPQIVNSARVREVRENETLTLNCATTEDGGGGGMSSAGGSSTTTVSSINVDHSMTFEWSKNGALIRPSNNVQLSGSGKMMHIMRAQVADSGTYNCQVRNEAGDDEAFFDVVVLKPPRIDGPPLRHMDATTNQSVHILCGAHGIPTPDMEWSRDSVRIAHGHDRYGVLENGTVLRIHTAEPGRDDGRYTCTATNKVGRAEADVFLQVIESPHIRVPFAQVKVIEGREHRIECIVGGIPPPSVEWRRNGDRLDEVRWTRSSAPLTEGDDDVSMGRRPLETVHFVHIRNARASDAGRYTCVANSRSGEARDNVQLIVLVPPLIADGERVFRVTEGGRVTLDCSARGTPPPEIMWRKEGANLNAPLKNRLFLDNLTSADGGRYTCEALNEAGSVSADFVVEVLMRPRLRDYQNELRVVENSQARLQCKADGNPEPTVQWLRSGRPITDMTNFILSPRGETLMILKTKRADAGTYSCNVKNSAGEIEAPFTVIVLTAPHIDQAIDQNPRVVNNNSIVFDCPVLGHPTPVVQWLKDGQLQDAATDGQNVVHDGNNLRIHRVTMSDAGRYTCEARNEVGLLNTEYQLEVLAPPKFSTEGQKSFEVVEGDSVTITCPVEAQPPPKIEWLRDGEPIEPRAEDNRIRVLPESNKLSIASANLRDGGKYLCMATNVAGKADINLILKVLVPPRIDKSNLINNPLAILGRKIFLECPASGIPQPTIIWMRDGVPIDFRQAAQGKYTLQQANQSLGIADIDLHDHGDYSCEVENKGGRSVEFFSVEVLVPPRMEEESAAAAGEPEHKTKREGEPLTLTCPIREDELQADARLESKLSITWTKDGRPLELTQNANYEISKDGRRLQIQTPSVTDAGQYKCVASNRAGQSHAKFDVEILSKPTIDGSQNEAEPHIIFGRPITLWCPAAGNPMPTIRWYRNNERIDPETEEERRYRILDQGQGLELTAADAADAAIWTCEAENAAGTTHMDISLDVWSEPVATVRTQAESPIRPIGSSITLFCNITGNPPPVITWTRDGQLILPSPDGIRISLSGTRLDIPRLEMDDSGVYECIAQNEVGAARSSISVDILLPPVIDRDGVELNPRLPIGRTLTLFCDSKGKPRPQVSWYINDTLIDNSTSNNYRFNIVFGENGRFIQVPNVTLTDSGIYKCQALNSAGDDEVVYKVDIFQSPQIVHGGTEQVTEGQVAVLACDSRGEPPPLITWQRNGVLVETGERYVVEDRLLKVIDTRISDSGIYVCVATNEAGTDQQAFTLEILIPPKLVTISDNETTVAWGSNVTLKCFARGYPLPKIVWTADGMTSMLHDSAAAGPDGAVIQPLTPNDDALVGAAVMEMAPKLLHDVFVEGRDFWTEEEGAVLHLVNVTHTSRRMFTCSAFNDAGVDEISYSVKTISPPIITKEGQKVQNVSEGEPLQISCDLKKAVSTADGTASSAADRSTTMDNKILWQKDSQPLKADGTSRRFLDTTQAELVFSAAQLSDAGNYSCRVENVAGSATQYTQVYVGVPPKITEKTSRRKLIVKRGSDAELSCEAVGIPPPNILWLKDNRTVSLNSGFFYTSRYSQIFIVAVSENNDPQSSAARRSVIFTDISPEQAGVYNCEAENWVGVDYLTVDLVVLIPPVIFPEKQNLSANVDETIILPCNASGMPEPVVSWIKVPSADIIGREDKYQILGTSLAIKKVTEADDGFYHCVAKSEAGQAVGVRRVSVNPPVQEIQTLWVECDESGQPIQNSYIHARGDTPESDQRNYLHWDVEYQHELPKNGSNGMIILCIPPKRFLKKDGEKSTTVAAKTLTMLEIIDGLVQPSDEVVEEEVESIMGNRDTSLNDTQTEMPVFVDAPPEEVIVDEEELPLRCRATGSPPPDVFWLKDEKIVTDAENDLTNSASLLRLHATDENATSIGGKYACVAVNSAGEIRAHTTVKVMRSDGARRR